MGGWNHSYSQLILIYEFIFHYMLSSDDYTGPIEATALDLRPEHFPCPRRQTMSVQPKLQYPTPAQPATQRPVRVVAKRAGASEMMPKPAPVQSYDFVGIAG